MAKRARKKPEIIGPTPEQQMRGCFREEDVTDKRNGGASITIGKAMRRRPMIDQLHDKGFFSEAEFKALKHYRHHADIAERSPIRDSLNRQRGGNGTGPGIELLNAVRVRDDCERAAGSLADILRAIVIYDQSPSEFAMERHGAIEECEGRGAKVVCRWKPRKKALDIAQVEIKIAANRVEAELSA